MPDWPFLIAGTGLIGLVGVTTLGWLSSVLTHRRTRSELAATDAERASLLDRAVDLEESRARLMTSIQTLESERERLVEQSHTVTKALREATTTVEALETRSLTARAELEEATERIASIERDRERLTRELRGVNEQLNGVQVRDRRNRQLLQALGVVPEARRRDPYEPDSRIRTRRALQQLLVDTPSVATALAGRHGLVSFASGDDTAVARMGATAAWVAEIEAELAMVLCAPVDSVSLMDRRFCTHLLTVAGTSTWLGLENRAEAPLFAMRRALVDIVGLPAPNEVVTPPSGHVLDLDDAPDEVLSERLAEWARRWSADAVTVLDAEGRPDGATVAAQPSSVMALRRVATPLLRRLLRDGRGLDGLSLVARAADGTVGTFQIVGDDLEAPFVAVVGPVELPSSALDELTGIVRWHGSSNLQARAAS